MFPLFPENVFSSTENAVRMTSFLSGPGLPPFKLPSSGLPPGFARDPERRSLLMMKRLNEGALLDQAKKRSEWKNWEWTDGLVERKLRIAVSTNNIELVQSYLFSGVNPNCVDSMGRSPLHLASCSGYSDIVRLLLENGANPNQRDRLGNTPLHLAACTNNIVVVTLLLKAGTDVCTIDLHGRSPLQLAQSKLKLLQKHMSGDGTSENCARNQSFQVVFPPKQSLETIAEMPVYDNAYVSNQALQIVEMIKLFLQKRGQEAEADLLSAFSSRLNLSETKEQVETQVRDLLDSLSGLSLNSMSSASSASSANETQGSANATSVFNNNCTTSGPTGASFFSNAFSPSSSVPSTPFCSLMPSADSDSQAGPMRHRTFRRRAMRRMERGVAQLYHTREREKNYDNN
ncbi:homeobox protein Wariai-like [Thrips palmi]|uniref:Homeobox protein Wariai-like n=1 Tax=Thrips palmi TaxID=161013 RepID=A0A6P8ZYU0_THRPL|nr:homeobox protein Wariai-like [Thrips palmi]XP_034249927.1 homeobox protein Wariai-like [Thrips palmi]